MPFHVPGLITTAAQAVGLAPQVIGNGSPFGRLSGVVTAAVTLMALCFAFLTHVGAFGWTADPFIDLVASIAVGVVFGRGVGIGEGQTVATQSVQAQANLNTSLILAAHERLDKIKAPSVPLDGSRTVVGTASPADGGSSNG